MGTVFFARAHERKRNEKKHNNMMCFKIYISEKFQMFQAALYPPKKIGCKELHCCFFITVLCESQQGDLKTSHGCGMAEAHPHHYQPSCSSGP